MKMDYLTKMMFILVATSFMLISVKSLDPEIETKIDQFAKKLLTCREIVGLNIAVVKDEATIFKNGYGTLNLDDSKPVTADSIMSIASLTKAFTATLLGQVLKDNGYSWSTKVRDVLGEDFYFYDGLRTSQVTMRDLAAHTLGILNHNSARFQGLSRRDAAYKLRFFEPTSPFRDSFNYNNAIYGLLAYITERVSGKSWEDTMQEYIFDPSGMTSTTFTHFVNQTREDIALPYLTDRDTGKPRQMPLSFHSFWGKSGGSGSIMSNANDMAQWLKLQVGKGKVDGKVVLAEDVLTETHQTVNRIKQTENDPYKRPNIPVTYAQTGYALGWRVGWYRGLSMLLHTGTSWGYGALLTLLPDVNLGIYTGVTGEDGGYVGRRLLHMYVMDLLLGVEPWLNLTTACTFPEPWSPAKEKVPKRKVTKKTILNFENYEGTYGNFQYGNISFAENKSTSGLVLYYGKIGRWHLTASEKEHEFSGHGFEDMWSSYINSIKFSDVHSGKLSQVTIDFERTAPATFVRGLQISDAPPPPNPDECGSETTDNASYLKCNILVIFVCIILIFTK